MTLRVTQQVVEVLIVNPTGGTTLDDSITTSVGMVSTMVIESPLDDSLTTSIGINDELVDIGLIDISIQSTINMSPTFPIEPNEIYIKTTVGITNTALTVEPIIEISSEIGITDTLTDNFETEDITTTVGINQVIIDDTDDDLTVLIKTEVGFNIPILVEEQDEQLTTSISLVSDAYERDFFTDTLGMVLTLDLIIEEPPIDTQVSIENTISIQTIENISISTSIAILDPIAAEDDINECQYDPQIGGPTGLFDAISPTGPTIGKATLTLSYPVGAPTLSVVLRNPQFGNLDTLTYNRVNRQSRGGSLLVFADPIWPKSQRFEFTIPYLCADDKPGLQTFLQTSLGQPITMLDWHNRSWNGVIINEPDFTQIGRDAYAVNFVFEVTP